MKLKHEQQRFYLDIRYSENNSWQGSIQRLDTGENINFRSALELLTLMESVVAEQNAEESIPRFRQWKSLKEVDKFRVRNGTTGR